LRGYGEFVLSPCPIEDVGHDQPKKRGNSYVLFSRERVGVRAGKTKNHFGSGITDCKFGLYSMAIFIPLTDKFALIM